MGLVRRATLALAVAAALIGCTGGGDRLKVDGTPAGMRAAAQSTLQHAASRGTITIKLNVGGRDVTIAGDAQIDQRRRIIAMHLDMGDYVGTRSSALPPAIAAGLRDMQVVLTPSAMYMHLPALTQQLGSDAQWIKFDLSSINAGIADLLGGSSAFTSDPTAVVRLLQGATDVDVVGQEQVGDVKTTHYRGTYTMRSAIEQSPADQRDAMQRLVNGFELPDRALDAPIAFDAWVDHDGIVRRFHTLVDLPALSGNRSASAVDSDIELSGFGETAAIVVPADADTFDGSSMFSSPATASSSGPAVN